MPDSTLGQYNVAPPAPTDGQYVPLQVDASGNLKTTAVGGGGGAVTIANGADVVEGALADAAIVTDANGTVSGKLRGLVKILADVWDSVAHTLKVAVIGTVTVDGSGVTQPVSNAGLSNLDVALSTRTKPADQQHAIIDSGTVAVTSAGLTNLDVALSTRTKPADQQHTILDSGTLTSITNALPSGTNVIGHVIIDSGSTTTVTGNVTVIQGTGTNLHTVIDSGTITTVSTVTAVTAITNPLPAGTNAIGKLAANDGVDIGDVTINNAAGVAAVNIQDGGNTITVDGAVSVTGSVTANAGTNLNTSLLALEAGGNLATINTNTTPLVTAGAGGYIRQDSTATIAKESGGNLATIAAKDFATSAKQDTGNTTLTSIDTHLTGLLLAQGSLNDSTQDGPLVLGTVSDLPLSYLTDELRPLSLTPEGRLRVSSVDSYIDKVWMNTFNNLWDGSDSPWQMENRYV